MAPSDRHTVTRMLLDLQAGGESRQAASDQLFEILYGELHGIAARLMRAERPDHTVQSTALVHEAYLRLVDGGRVAWENRAHFFGVASRAMRQVLVDHARARGAAKRGGGWQRITLHDDLGVAPGPDPELMDLEAALKRLGEKDARMARVVELRVFGGLTAKEAGHVLGISRQTVHEDWRVARMWLRRELGAADAS